MIAWIRYTWTPPPRYLSKRARNYLKLYEGLLDAAERNITPQTIWSGLRVLADWIDKIPPAKKPGAEERRYTIALEPALRRAGEILAADLEDLGRKLYPQYWRPAYARVYYLLPLATYHGWDRDIIAREAGVSRATVRNALWFARRLGADIPYGAFEWVYPW